MACWNRTAKGLAGEVEEAAEAVAEAAVVAVYLKDSPAVRGVFAQVGDALTPGQVVLNHSTVDLETTQWLEAFCHQRGCRFLDLPFTGSRLAAEAGNLVYYAGGDADLINEVEPFLRLTGKEVLHCGGVGSATVVKLATNLISACTVQALAEAMAIATGHGVPADAFKRAVEGNLCCSPLAAFKLPSMTEGNFDTHFSLDNMRKDSVYALQLAADAGLETPAIDAVSARMAGLCREGLGHMDYAALAHPYLAARTGPVD